MLGVNAIALGLRTITINFSKRFHKTSTSKVLKLILILLSICAATELFIFFPPNTSASSATNEFINFIINPLLHRTDVITNCRAIEFLWVVILKPLTPKVSASEVALRVQSLSDCSDSKSMNRGSVTCGALVQLSPARRPA